MSYLITMLVAPVTLSSIFSLSRARTIVDPTVDPGRYSKPSVVVPGLRVEKVTTAIVICGVAVLEALDLTVVI